MEVPQSSRLYEGRGGLNYLWIHTTSNMVYSWPKIVQTTQGHGLSGYGLPRDHCTSRDSGSCVRIVLCVFTQWRHFAVTRHIRATARNNMLLRFFLILILHHCVGCPRSAAPADSNWTSGAMSSVAFRKMPVDYRSSPFLIETSRRERRELRLAERTWGWRADGRCAGALLAAGTVPGAVARRIAVIVT